MKKSKVLGVMVLSTTLLLSGCGGKSSIIDESLDVENEKMRQEIIADSNLEVDNGGRDLNGYGIPVKSITVSGNLVRVIDPLSVEVDVNGEKLVVYGKYEQIEELGKLEGLQVYIKYVEDENSRNELLNYEEYKGELASWLKDDYKAEEEEVDEVEIELNDEENGEGIEEVESDSVIEFDLPDSEGDVEEESLDTPVSNSKESFSF